MTERYAFNEPDSIKECKQRLRVLRREIRDIDRQLGDKSLRRTDVWRAKALSSRAYKETEYDYLKEELIELRRLLTAREADVYHHNDPRHLLLRLREEVGKKMKREPNKLKNVIAVVDRYFEHDGSIK